jgi:hypothetical protein
MSANGASGAGPDDAGAPDDVPRFCCDAMLGGLARWLRALGYEAAFEHGIDDAALVGRAATTGAILLSSDRPLFERRAVRAGAVRALFVPRHAPVIEQATFVLRAFELEVRAPRCMRCGGALVEVARDAVRAEVPPKSLGAYETFYRCAACGGVFWHGTHWTRIEATRAEIARRLARG